MGFVSVFLHFEKMGGGERGGVFSLPLRQIRSLWTELVNVTAVTLEEFLDTDLFSSLTGLLSGEDRDV